MQSLKKIHAWAQMQVPLLLSCYNRRARFSTFVPQVTCVIFGSDPLPKYFTKMISFRNVCIIFIISSSGELFH